MYVMLASNHGCMEDKQTVESFEAFTLFFRTVQVTMKTFIRTRGRGLGRGRVLYREIYALMVRYISSFRYMFLGMT